MASKRLPTIVFQNIRRNKKNFVFSSIGIIVAVTIFGFFYALIDGIRVGVLNKVYPINQIEVEPSSMSFMGIKDNIGSATVINEGKVGQFESVEGVAGVYPKQRSKFHAILWGGKDIFGKVAHFEAFFDGIEPSLIIEEMGANEDVDKKEWTQKYKRDVACETDDDCGTADECRDGMCKPILYHTKFADYDDYAMCKDDDHCLPGEICEKGECLPGCFTAKDCAEGQTCAPRWCADKDACDDFCTLEPPCPTGKCITPCTADAQCAKGTFCVHTPCKSDDECGGATCADGLCSGEGVCGFPACKLAKADYQMSDDLTKMKGTLVTGCEGDDCPAIPCPGESYCATKHRKSVDGHCEYPIPVALSPFILEIYNSTAATALHLQRVSGIELLLGLKFKILYGNSFFVKDAPKNKQVVKSCQIVGFTNKALDLGVTMPLGYVKRINAHFQGTTSASEYDSVIIETAHNEDIPAVSAAVDKMGFELSRKSQDARKAGNMLFILTVIFSIIALVVMLVAAINITHTFLMIVYERKREIGIMRAIGASKRDIRVIFIAEAALIGLFGGLMGNLMGWLAGILVDFIGHKYLKTLPFLPESFFNFTLDAVLMSVGFAILFCLIGAFFPANRAAKLDPAVVMTSV